MKEERISIPIGKSERVSGLISIPGNFNPGQDQGVILAHGAGNDMSNPFLCAVADGLSDKGILTMRFNFPYKEKGKKAPDPPAKLEMTWLAACNWLKTTSEFAPKKLTAAGKSMGGRIASQLAAQGRLPIERLIFYGYPLHPAGKPDILRDEHLYRITCPMLFFAGTRDPLCGLGELGRVLGRFESLWSLEVIEGGDHSFKLPKSMGQDQNRIYDKIVFKTVEWLQS